MKAQVKDYRVLFVASEAVPFSKTGGLADVAGALPRELKRQGCDVRVVLPFYRATRETGIPFEPCLENLPVEIAGEPLPATVWLAYLEEGVPCYFVQRDDLFDRSHLYGTPEGDYPDNALRFTYFCKAAFSLCQALSYGPDVMHCHDWQTALIPAYLRHVYGPSALFRKTRSLLTLHNIAYQGVFPPSEFPRTGLPDTFLSVGGVEFSGQDEFPQGWAPHGPRPEHREPELQPGDSDRGDGVRAGGGVGRARAGPLRHPERGGL